MKKIFLVLILVLFSVNSFAILGFGKKKKEEPTEIQPAIIKQCFYQMEHSPNTYTIFSVLQESCDGVHLVGVVSGRMIIEYDENLDESNRQLPKTDDAFREKVDALWPELGEIKFKQ